VGEAVSHLQPSFRQPSPSDFHCPREEVRCSNRIPSPSSHWCITFFMYQLWHILQTSLLAAKSVQGWPKHTFMYHLPLSFRFLFDSHSRLSLSFFSLTLAFTDLVSGLLLSGFAQFGPAFMDLFSRILHSSLAL
jgi:hypothetical protein